jgi:hypothetical protein
MIHPFLRRWLNALAGSPHPIRRRITPPPRSRSWLVLEALEGRCLPSTVTNLTDHDPGSLRNAIATTPAGGTVDFQPGLSGTITLTTGELAISKNLTIAGPGADVITVSGNDSSRVFGVFVGTVDISGLTIANGGGSSFGGGIYNQGTLTVTASTLSGNAAIGLGGGIYNQGTMTVTASTLTGNAASGVGNGGGIYNQFGGKLTITDSTVSGNTAISGGGIYIAAGSLTITSSTVSGNAATSGGGGIDNTAGPQAITSRNTILAGNTAPSSPDVSGTLNSQGHNLIGDGTGGSGFHPTDLVGTSSNPIDPKLGPLQDNGGPTQTMALLPSSPAIAAGDPTGASQWDQRGPDYSRLVAGITDIGAFQVQTTQVFRVTTAQDAGAGSLRQAILDANAASGFNVIAFDILGAGTVINVASELPALTVPVFVNGTSQSGFTGAPRVLLNGTKAGPGANGLTVTRGGTIVRGLVVNGFDGAGILLLDDGGNLIAGDYLGTNISGTVAVGNGVGVSINDFSGDTIGLSQTTAASRNVIAGNHQDGVAIVSGSGNTMQGNFIGTDAAGMAALPNGYGVEIFSGSFNTIGGGPGPGAGNVVSGNLSDGLAIYSDGNVIQGNRIGTDVTGTSPLGNGGDGVMVLAYQYGYNNAIGGTEAGAGNTIAYNGGYGVRVTNGTGEAIHENAIYANGAGGIGLFGGANQAEPAPQLTAATSGGGTTTVSGSVAGAPNAVLVVEFFANTVCDPSGYGQGERFLGSVTVSTDADGVGNFMTTLPVAVDVGQFITATATDTGGNTSQFSNCQVVTGTSDPTGPSSGKAGPVGSVAADAGADSAATTAAPLPAAGRDGAATAPTTAAAPVQGAMPPHAQDAVFAGWDTGTDGLMLDWM